MMERIEIVGRRQVDFTDKSGRQVTGVSYYYLMQREGTDGSHADKVFVSSARLPELSYVPQVGDTVDVFYDRYGKPSNFSLVKSA